MNRLFPAVNMGQLCLAALIISLHFCTGISYAKGFGLQDGKPIYEAYKANFIQKDGRVIDTFQKDFSHSEAQAFGLLLALKFNDQETFDKILRWTQNNLQLRRSDHLLCWSWGRRAQGSWIVRDYNNASDGDILAAWALLKAEKKWHEPIYRKEALAIIRDIRSLLFVKIEGRPILLPGYSGFVKDGGKVEYNPSYFIPAAFQAFAQAGDMPSFWQGAIENGFRLQQKASFGRFSMPANWVIIDRSATGIPPQRPGRYGYDAVRIWLYTSQWMETRGMSSPAARCMEGLENFLLFFEHGKWIPAEVSMKDNFVSTEDAPAGFYMIYSRAMNTKGNIKLAQRLKHRAIEKINEEKDNYYSCSLFLLALY